MTAPAALQRYSDFVARTQNWLYDHLRMVPKYRIVVRCDKLLHRDEFPELEAHVVRTRSIPERALKRVLGWRFYPDELRVLRTLRPRLLHSHFGDTADGDRALQDELDCPWFVSFYGADAYHLPRLPGWRARYQSMFGTASRVLALGPAMRDELLSLGCPDEKLVVHPLGIDLDVIPFVPRDRAQTEPIRLLFAGTFREKKGLSYLLEAVALLHRVGVRVSLDVGGDAALKAGDLAEKSAILERTRALGLEAHVHFHGWLSFTQLLNLSRTCHVFVAPSVTAADGDKEGTPFVLQQMMASGISVVSTQHSDIPFLFGDRGDLLVPERDAEALAAAIERFLISPGALRADPPEHRSRMAARFDARRQARVLAELYDTSVAP